MQKEIQNEDIPKTIEEYILHQSEEAQPYLMEVYRIIREAIPDAKEKISWKMPTFWKKRNLIQFAAFQKHIGLYPGPAGVCAFAHLLSGYKMSKGAIQFPYKKPLPLDVIRQIAIWCRKEYGD